VERNKKVIIPEYLSHLKIKIIKKFDSKKKGKGKKEKNEKNER
jgi:hypothetical protein